MSVRVSCVSITRTVNQHTVKVSKDLLFLLLVSGKSKFSVMVVAVVDRAYSLTELIAGMRTVGFLMLTLQEDIMKAL